MIVGSFPFCFFFSIQPSAIYFERIEVGCMARVTCKYRQTVVCPFCVYYSFAYCLKYLCFLFLYFNCRFLMDSQLSMLLTHYVSFFLESGIGIIYWFIYICIDVLSCLWFTIMVQIIWFFKNKCIPLICINVSNN